jgi:hypothetical protein
MVHFEACENCRNAATKRFTFTMEDINLDSEKLLESSSSSSNDDNKDIDEYLQGRMNDSRKVRRYKIIGVVLLLLLGLTNFGWYWQYPRISWRQEAAYMSYCNDNLSILIHRLR